MHILFKKIYISLISLVYYYIQFASAQDVNNKHNQNAYYNEFSKFINNSQCFEKKTQKIHIESDIVNIYYPTKMELLGNVCIKRNFDFIKTNKLTIYHHFNKNNLSNTILSAEENITYYNKNTILTGKSAKFNLNNKNIDIYDVTYSMPIFHFHGHASTIMYRKNNQYAIINQGNFTTCMSNKDCWSITGSKIVYDYFNEKIYIWNPCLRIKSIPVFYSPYLLLFISNNYKNSNILKSYIPSIKYNNECGLIFKTPIPLFFSKYYSSIIAPYYIVNHGIGLNTKIYYKNNLKSGKLITDIIKYDINKNNEYNCNKNYKLYWQHREVIDNKWHLNADYIYLYQNNHKYYCHNNNSHTAYPNVFEDQINQKILLYYNNEYSKVSIAYLGNINNNNNDNNNMRKYDCFYSVFPKIEMNFFLNPVRYNFFNLQIYNQFSKFIPSNQMYPKSIRIHIEPIINHNICGPWIRLTTQSKLKITHYQQDNINDYNIHQNNQKFFLKHKINRIVPQFKATGKIIFPKKINAIKKFSYILEPKLQYLYTPYYFQENIGIYDTKIIYTNYHNLFYGEQYSGLDRISPKNQITGDITIRCLTKYKDIFRISTGQIMSIMPKNNTEQHLYNFDTISKIKLLYLNTEIRNINNSWNICSEIQYNPEFKSLSFGNIMLEYLDEKNMIFQTNYRYIDSKYLQKDIINHRNSNYFQEISQLGIVLHYPLRSNWIISFSNYHNIKSNLLIDQTIGVRYFNSCWVLSLFFEHNIINKNNNIHYCSYERKLKINFNLLDFKTDLKLNVYKFLNSKLISYQHIYNDS